MNKLKKPRIVFLTQYYPPETGAPQNRLSSIAQGLLLKGFDVQVITAIPNYPLGKIYQGYKWKLYKKTLHNNIPVTYCWLFTTTSKSIFLRLINYFSFAFSSGLIGSLTLQKIDLLIVESPPLFLSITAWWLSILKGAKIILNVSDLYPDTAISLGMLRQTWLQKIFYAFEAWSYKISSLITGQTEGIVNSIQTRFPSKKVYLLTNGIDLNILKKRPEKIYATNNHFIVGYAGVLGYAQNLPIILDAAKKLISNPDIEFHIYGDGPISESLKQQVKENELKNVKILGHRSHEDILILMNSWNIGLVPLIDKPLMSGALPSKMFEVMGLGIPVLLCAPEGEASRVIKLANAGIWVTPNSSQLITDAILQLYNDQGRCSILGGNGKYFAESHFNRGRILDDFVSVLLNEFEFMK
jgi:glycosyltransferase involved in cell wall biosynthesis